MELYIIYVSMQIQIYINIVYREDRIVHWISGCGQTPWNQFEWQVQYLLHTIDIPRRLLMQCSNSTNTVCFQMTFFTNRYQLRMNAPVSFIARPQRYCIIFNTIIFNEYPSAQNELQVHEKLFIFFPFLSLPFLRME